MRQKSILLYHILIIGVISVNLNPSDRVINMISRNTLRRNGNDANSDNTDMKNKCSHVETDAITAKENKKHVPSCQHIYSRHTENVLHNSDFHFSSTDKISNFSSFIKKLTTLNTVIVKELQYHPNREDIKENQEAGNLHEERYFYSQDISKERTKGGPFKYPLGNVSNTPMKTNKRRDLRPDARLKLDDMKRNSLSTEQSITLKSLSDNDGLSKDNSNDTVHSKEADTNELNQLRSIISELTRINQREKEVTIFEPYTSGISVSQTTFSSNLDENITETYLMEVGNNSNALPTKQGGYMNTTMPSLPSWDFTTDSVHVDSSKALLNLLHNISTMFPLHTTTLTKQQDVTRESAVPDDDRYGKIKYSDDVKATANAIESLKSRLDRKWSFVESLEEENSLTTVPNDLSKYIEDIFTTNITPDSLYFANDSAVSLNKSANKVLQDIPWPVKKEAVVEGDVIIGGLMMVHEREDSITCGPIMPQGGVQALEAMLYTLDQINLVIRPFLPNITLGAHILDDCDKDTYGLEMAVDFIKGTAASGPETCPGQDGRMLEIQIDPALLLTKTS